MKITIKITQEDIVLGQRSKCWFCPAARALQRATNNPNLGVDGDTIFTGPPGRCKDIGVVPPKLTEFIVRFDNKLPVRPRSFKLKIPDEYVLEGAA